MQNVERTYQTLHVYGGTRLHLQAVCCSSRGFDGSTRFIISLAVGKMQFSSVREVVSFRNWYIL